uniref:Spore coat protein n=1 Tax=Siphoviridae sp. ctTnV63 TaxID=2825523 RepID=A0A8S5NWL8_9CAUD|nr:MAG TPA: Spore coat protein [Siphoviridae sp. ctTnV63]
MYVGDFGKEKVNIYFNISKAKQAKIYIKETDLISYGLLIDERYYIFADNGDIIDLKNDNRYILLKVYNDWVDFEEQLMP